MDPARIFTESLTPRPELENGELDPTPGIREQPGSLTDVRPNERHVRLGFASGPPTDVARRVNQRDMRRHIFSWRPVR